MLVPETEGRMKYVCPDCGGDNVGESGMGGRYIHCFGVCMKDLEKASCPTAPVTSSEEAITLSQEPY